MSSLPRITMGTVLAQTILSAVDNGREGPVNPANWPADAMFAAEYRYRDRQFPNVQQSRHTTYFVTADDLLAWKREKVAFCEGTDGDFTILVTVWAWDWGPEIIHAETITQHS